MVFCPLPISFSSSTLLASPPSFLNAFISSCCPIFTFLYCPCPSTRRAVSGTLAHFPQCTRQRRVCHCIPAIRVMDRLRYLFVIHFISSIGVASYPASRMIHPYLFRFALPIALVWAMLMTAILSTFPSGPCHLEYSVPSRFFMASSK